MHASFCLLLWQPVLALHPAPRAAPALGARRTAPPARAVRHDAPRLSTDSNPDSLEDVFEALLKVRSLGWIGLARVRVSVRVRISCSRRVSRRGLWAG